jgi:type IV pilus assembly protein PilX
MHRTTTSGIQAVGLSRTQNGAVLVIGLLLLVIITILAVSGMNTATTELIIARNNQSFENAFQAAEYGLEQAIAQGRYSTTEKTDLGQFLLSSNDSVGVVTEFEDSTPIPDRAFSLGVSSGNVAFHFVATATAESLRSGSTSTVTNRDASAIHTQAFYVIGPQSSALEVSDSKQAAR